MFLDVLSMALSQVGPFFTVQLGKYSSKSILLMEIHQKTKLALAFGKKDQELKVTLAIQESKVSPSYAKTK